MQKKKILRAGFEPATYGYLHHYSPPLSKDALQAWCTERPHSNFPIYSLPHTKTYMYIYAYSLCAQIWLDQEERKNENSNGDCDVCIT